MNQEKKKKKDKNKKKKKKKKEKKKKKKKKKEEKKKNENENSFQIFVAVVCWVCVVVATDSQEKCVLDELRHAGTPEQVSYETMERRHACTTASV